MQVKEGDIVSLRADAVYYSEKEIPGWIKKERWYIKSVNGDRAVLGKSAVGDYEINSPVNVKYLTVENAKEETAQRPEPAAGTSPAVQAAESPQQETVSEGSANAVSDNGVELIARYEGCRLEAYLCPAGVWTIGYGHTAGVEKGQTLPSKDAAKALLKEDLKKYGGYVNECVKKGLIKFPLTQNQFDALTSFCYNCGNGSLRKLVTDRSAGEIAEKMLLYNKGGGKVLPGLTRRREEERALFLS